MKDNNTTKNFLLGFLAGGTLGAVLALLYAPKSGKELRQDIKVKKDELMEEAEKHIADAKVKAKDLINEGKKKSESLIAEAKEKGESIMKEAEKVFENAKDKIASETERLKTAGKAGMDAYKETKQG